MPQLYVTKVEKKKGPNGRYLHVEVASSGSPSYLRQAFAGHVQAFLRRAHPELEFTIDPIMEGRVYSVLGYDTNEAQVEVKVKIGKDGEVIVQPTIGRNGFLGKYKCILEAEKLA